MKIKPCSTDIYESGETACVLDACRVRAEHWVQAVAQLSGQRVDWHYSGGRVSVLYLGDRERVDAAIKTLASQLERETVIVDGEHCRCRSGVWTSDKPTPTHHSACRILQ